MDNETLTSPSNVQQLLDLKEEFEAFLYSDAVSLTTNGPLLFETTFEGSNTIETSLMIAGPITTAIVKTMSNNSPTNPEQIAANEPGENSNSTVSYVLGGFASTLNMTSNDSQQDLCITFAPKENVVTRGSVKLGELNESYAKDGIKYLDILTQNIKRILKLPVV